jgi:hypothetical protein
LGLATIGSPSWNNWFNLFAATFAAMTAGYLAPADAICRAEAIQGTPYR